MKISFFQKRPSATSVKVKLIQKISNALKSTVVLENENKKNGGCSRNDQKSERAAIDWELLTSIAHYIDFNKYILGYFRSYSSALSRV